MSSRWLGAVRYNIATLVRRRRVVYAFAAVLALCLLGYGRAHRAASHAPYRSASDRLMPPSPHAFDRIRPDLHLLIPATEPNAELCKCLVTALVLGYPTPVLLNWGNVYSKSDELANGTHIAKIDGALAYLSSLPENKNDELVLMADGYDNWFQLRPDVLKSRYKQIVREAFHRTESRLGPRVVVKESISQSLIFSAQKSCGPSAAQLHQVGCYGQPESPEPADLYGEDTDILDPESHLPLHMRPAFLNSGMIIGPVADMRLLMARAHEKSMKSTVEHHGSDQAIFNEIYGEQEYHREVTKQRYRTWRSKTADFGRWLIGSKAPTILDQHPSHNPVTRHDAHDAEYGISLDYRLELIMSAVFSEFDGRFLTYDNENLMKFQLSGEGLPDPPRASQLPEYVSGSKPLPYHDLTSPGVELATNWSQVPLYSNLWTATVPVMLHMNGFKSMRTALWDQLWLTAHLRDHFNAVRNNAFKDERSNPIPWQTVCGPFEEEIFRSEHEDPDG